jgi:hypothetical protein
MTCRVTHHCGKESVGVFDSDDLDNVLQINYTGAARRSCDNPFVVANQGGCCPGVFCCSVTKTMTLNNNKKRSKYKCKAFNRSSFASKTSIHGKNKTLTFIKYNPAKEDKLIEKVSGECCKDLK